MEGIAIITLSMVNQHLTIKAMPKCKKKQNRFSSLARLNIETDLTASLVPEDMVQMYASIGATRLPLL